MESIPRHIAVIMDGNGRWARKQGRLRIFGHRQGVKSSREVIRHASDLGVEYLTLYVFSSENWHRPAREVNFLMGLIAEVIDGEVDEMMKNNVVMKVIGDMDRLPKRARTKLQNGIDRTSVNTGMQLQLAISYGGRQEIVDGCKALGRRIAEGSLRPEDITEDVLSQQMYIPEVPDPELMIRTGGEYRISNFLLWQFAYSELYVTNLFWPDFGPKDLDDAIQFLKTRERRFGRVEETVDE